MIRWHDLCQWTRKRNNKSDSPLFDTNTWLHDLTQTVLLKTKFKAVTCNIILCRSLYKLLSKISYAFLLPFHRVTRPVHLNVLHVTTLTKLDGLKESRRSSRRRLINHFFTHQSYYFNTHMESVSYVAYTWTDNVFWKGRRILSQLTDPTLSEIISISLWTSLFWSVYTNRFLPHYVHKTSAKQNCTCLFF